jgi:hypothetical protein
MLRLECASIVCLWIFSSPHVAREVVLVTPRLLWQECNLHVILSYLELWVTPILAALS